MYQYIDNNQSMNRIALITGATRNLGFSLVQDLARRLEPADIVYLTGRDAARVAQSMKNLTGANAQVRGEVLDVSKRDAVERFADELAGRHGGVDIVLSNHYTRVQPEDNPAEVIDYFAATANTSEPLAIDITKIVLEIAGGPKGTITGLRGKYGDARAIQLVYAATAPADPLMSDSLGREQGAASQTESRTERKTIITRALLGSDAGLYGAARVAVPTE